MIELDRTFAAVFVGLRRNDRLDSQGEQIFVNPVGAISLVAAQLHRPSNGFSLAVEQLCVGAFQQRVERGGVVGLTRRQMKMQRVALAIAKQVKFCGKAPARTP